eukprot:TRINITY_DN17326_c0_g1_i7.p2 TRINITY_DN17326_c0_g1~~TRINITY_DN17326_c0_g1_i7.p2  ORF type:complete len:101 (-),score=11.67 TRINITY_DN17326_c0_g1_i7:24-326(-)
MVAAALVPRRPQLDSPTAVGLPGGRQHRLGEAWEMHDTAASISSLEMACKRQPREEMHTVRPPSPAGPKLYIRLRLPASSKHTSGGLLARSAAAIWQQAV